MPAIASGTPFRQRRMFTGLADRKQAAMTSPAERTDDPLAAIQWLDCSERLPVQPAAQCLRYTQLLVPGDVPGRWPVPESGRVGDALAERLGERLLERVGVAAARWWQADAVQRSSTAELRVLASRHSVPGTSADSAEEPLRKVLGQWLPAQRTRWIEQTTDALQALFPDYLQPTAADSLPELLAPLWPRPDASLEDFDQPLLAICAHYQQQWEHQGYSRGELLATFALAPGEQLTLDFHHWDKQTVRSEEELAEASEHQLQQGFSVRDSQDVLNELVRQQGSRLDSELKLSLPLPVAEGTSLGGSAGQSQEQQLSTTLRQTLSRVTEQTRQSTDSLRQQRRQRIEVSRDAGRETRQQRQLQNANRARVMHCRYFEVQTHYRVMLRVRALEPCLLLPLPALELSPAALLANQVELQSVLLDPARNTGFIAARQLLLEAELERQRQAELAARQAAADAAQLPALKAERQAILVSLAALRAAVAQLQAAWQRPEVQQAAHLGARVLGVALTLELGSLRALRRTLALALLRSQRVLWRALLALEEETAAQAGALRQSLDCVQLAWQQRDAQQAAAVREALVDVGLPRRLAPLVLLLSEVLRLLEDDAGLSATIAQQSQARSAAGYAGTGGGSAGQRAEEATAGRLQRAEAQLELDLLRSHLEAHSLHYRQALWLKLHPDLRALRLRGLLPAATRVLPEIAGFHEDRVAHPLTDADAVPASLRSALQQLHKQLPEGSVESLVLPTPGVELQTQLGPCDAIEAYIVDSRRIELEAAQAQADQQRLEARRRESCLSATPPRLGPFDGEPAPPALAAGTP